MKVSVKRTIEKLQKKEFHSDDLYKFYDFHNGNYGDILINARVVTNLYEKTISSKDEAIVARQVIEFIRNCDIEEKGNYNWNLYSINGNVEIKTGYLLAKIAMNEEEFIEYIDRILSNGNVSVVEFSL